MEKLLLDANDGYSFSHTELAHGVGHRLISANNRSLQYQKYSQDIYICTDGMQVSTPRCISPQKQL